MKVPFKMCPFSNPGYTHLLDKRYPTFGTEFQGDPILTLMETKNFNTGQLYLQYFTAYIYILV